MTSPHDVLHQYRSRAQTDEQNAILADLVEVMAEQAEVLKVQAATAQSSQRSAWRLSICTIVVAAGSLAVAILALILR